VTAQTVETTPEPLRAIVERKPLLDALRWVQRLSIPVRPHVPILASVVISVDRGGLTISGYDYDCYASMTIPCKGGGGVAAVSARVLADMLAALPPKSDVVMRAEGSRVVLSAGNVTFRLPTYDLTQIPTSPQLNLTVDRLLLCSGAGLKSMARVTCAVGRDQSLPVLTAVGIQQDKPSGRTAVVATDRYRMAWMDVGPVAAGWPQETDTVLVPARIFEQVASGFKDLPQVSVDYDHEHGLVRFDTPAASVIVRPIDGTFPKWRGLIPESFAVVFEVDRQELDTAVTQASVAAARNSPMWLNVTQDTVTIATGEAEHEDEPSGTVTIPGQCLEGGMADIGFTPAYLRAGLRALEGDRVQLSLQKLRPGVMRSTDDPAFTYLVMPVRRTE
jgi:DNA polymerase-3 subunit beta